MLVLWEDLGYNRNDIINGGDRMQNFLTVGQQVLILFILIMIGFVLGKKKIIGDGAAKALSDIALLLATPCVIALSFAREYDADVLKQLGIAIAVAVVIHLVAIGIAQLLYRKSTPRDRVMRAATVLSNAGFMGLPLQQAVLGEQGVFYGSAYVTVFTLTLWSYGLITMDSSSRRLSVKKLLVNPGIIGLCAGILILFLPIDLPELVRAPASHLAALNTPLPMLFIGYGLSKVELGKALRNKSYYAVCALRLLIVPAVAIGVLYLVGIRGTMLCSMAIAASAPIAAAVSMFADRFGQDTESAVNLVALSTVFSVITMPVFVALVQLVA